VIILLSHLGWEQELALVRSVPDVDVIIGGNYSRLRLEEAQRIGETGPIVVNAGYLGKWLGVLELVVDREGRIVSFTARRVLFDESIPADPVMQTWLEASLWAEGGRCPRSGG